MEPQLGYSLQSPGTPDLSLPSLPNPGTPDLTLINPFIMNMFPNMFPNVNGSLPVQSTGVAGKGG